MKSYALTTVARLKSFLGITGSADDSLLEILIDIATEQIEGYCDRRFKRTAYTNEEYDGTGTNQVLLKQFPVDEDSTFSIEERGTTQREDDWHTVDETDYHIDWDSGIITFLLGFIEGPRLYRIDYTAGFSFDNSTTFLSDTGAGDLEYVIWKLAGDAYLNRKGAIGIERESIGDYSVGYMKDIMEDSRIKSILDKYKRY